MKVGSKEQRSRGAEQRREKEKGRNARGKEKARGRLCNKG